MHPADAAPAGAGLDPRAPTPALLLAGRRGPADAVAAAAGVSHRALVPVAGIPMLVRVARTLLATPGLGPVRVSLDDPGILAREPALAAEVAAGRLTLHASRESPAASVADALADAPGPLLVTTADHPLLTRAMLEHFLTRARASGADVAVGVVAASVVRAAHPASPRTFVPLRGEGWSGANLFWLRPPAAQRVAAFWRRAEQDRKRPWRLVRHFGMSTLAAFLLRRLDLDAALARVSRAVGARVVAVPLPFAEAAIDVDRPADLALAERLLAQRTE